MVASVDLTHDLDGFFLFTMSIFIFLLHLGFGMVEIAVSKKATVIDVMLKVKKKTFYFIILDPFIFFF